MTPSIAQPALPADWRDLVALTKPRVMSLVVFTGLCGLLAAPVTLPPVLGFTAILCIALGAGAAGALNQWYEADLDAKMRRTANRPLPARRMDRQTALHFGVGLSVFSVILMDLATNHLAAAAAGGFDPVLRPGLHRLAEAADRAEHRHRRRRGRLPAADRLGRGDRAGSSCFRCCCSRSSSCGRRRISGRCRCSFAPTMRPPTCRCCRSSPGSRTRGCRSCSTALTVAVAAIAPWALGLTGLIYGVAAAVLNAIFVVLAAAVFANRAERAERDEAGEAAVRFLDPLPVRAVRRAGRRPLGGRMSPASRGRTDSRASASGPG